MPMSAPANPWTLTARWICPVDGPPLESGTVTIDGERIVAVEPHGRRHADIDFGNVAVLPGLVNAHTHLDLSGLRGRCPPGGTAELTDWLRDVIRHRRSQTHEQIAADVRTGLAESIACGTTLLGDISAQGASWPVLADAPIRSVVFFELLGLPRSRAEAALAAAQEWLTQVRSPTRVRRGLSPHAPYSVHSLLFQAAAELARLRNIPLATHLAESLEELALLRDRSGPFRDFLAELGVWEEEGLAHSPGEVIRLTRTAPQLLLVHSNYLPLTADVPAHASVIYCPRTHAAFGHAPHPFEQWLARGVNVALGTDSLASNPDIDVLAEARFLHRLRPQLDGATLLRLATLNGAIALGWGDDTGSLTPFKSADLVVLPLADRASQEPHEAIFASTERVQAVMCRGQWVH